MPPLSLTLQQPRDQDDLNDHEAVKHVRRKIVEKENAHPLQVVPNHWES